MAQYFGEFNLALGLVIFVVAILRLTGVLSDGRTENERRSYERGLMMAAGMITGAGLAMLWLN
jgi:hypothetical protein